MNLNPLPSLCTALFLCAPALNAADLGLLSSQLKTEFIVRTSETDDVELQGWIDTQREDGGWPDFNYADTDPTGWEPYYHVNRLRVMAGHYADTSHPYGGNADLLASISKAFDFWLASGIRAGNWWYNDIGVPNRLGETVVLLGTELNDTQRNGAAALMPTTPNLTGQNKVWRSEGVIFRGLIEDSESRVTTGFNGISSTIVETTAEGIEHDRSFQQHGDQLYSGGYGLGYITDIAMFFGASAGTGFEPAAAKVTLMEELLLDGSSWMVRGDTMDYSTTGRELTRMGVTTKGKSVRYALERMKAIGARPANEYDSMIAHIDGDLSAGPMGNKLFWRSDYAVQRSQEAMVTVRMASNRVQVPEETNQEGIKSRYLGFGCQLIYRDGDEYDEIFPVWDWRKIPGTTVIQNGANPSRSNHTAGPDTFVGGASDGDFGLVCMDHSFEGLSAKKAWFFMDGGFVALGAGISATTSSPVWTTVNQTRLTGDLTIDGSIQPTGERTTSNPHWLHHDGVGYVMMGDSQVFSKNNAQSGSWYSINHIYTPQTTISQDIFMIGIDHGANPSGAGYAYAVLPGASALETEIFAASSRFNVVSNDPGAQVVCDAQSGRSGMVFYESGTRDTGLGFKLNTDARCALTLHLNGSELLVGAANPNASSVKLTLQIDGQLTGGNSRFSPMLGRSVVEIQLPGGADGGSTVLTPFQWKPYGDAGGPVAVPETSVQSAVPGETITFSAVNSLPGDSPISSYEWTFDDGAVENGHSVTHTFSAEGIYRVRLKVTDGDGRSSVAIAEVVVENRIPPVADAALRAGTFSNTNYGGDVSLVTKTPGVGDYYRVSVLRFPLDGFDAPLQDSVNLTLVVSNMNDPVFFPTSSPGKLQLFQSADTGWQENSVTYTTRPQRLAMIGEQPFLQVGDRVVFDVTTAVSAALQANKSFLDVEAKFAEGVNTFMTMGSRESPTPPYLAKVPGGSRYAAWLDRWFPCGPPSDDPDGDGIPNRIEFGLGGNPLSSGDGKWDAGTPEMRMFTGGGIRMATFETLWMDDESLPVFKCSGDLKTWTDVPAAYISRTGDLHSAVFPMDGECGFFRIEVPTK